MTVGKMLSKKGRSVQLLIVMGTVLLIVGGSLRFPGATKADEGASFATRNFGDPGNDTAIWNVTSHQGGRIYAKTTQSIVVNVVNYNTSHQDNVSLNFTVRNKASGVYENDTLGNTTLLLDTGAIEGRTLIWTPSAEGDYEIFISARNVTWWAQDVNQTNNLAFINVTIMNFTDVAAQIEYPVQGMAYEQNPMKVEAWFNNTGNVNITSGFNVTLEVFNGTTWARDFFETVTISSADVRVPGAAHLTTFSSWTPASTGIYIINVTTELAGDANASNNKSSASVTITPVYYRDFRITVDPREQFADPGGDPVSVTFTIVNNGTMSDSYSYTVTSGHNWIDPPSQNPLQGTTGTVVPGGDTSVYVSVRVPEGTSYDQIDRIKINVTSENNGSLRKTNSSWVYTYENHEVEVQLRGSTKNGNPGDTLDYVFRIINNGNIGENFTYTLSTLYGWEAYVRGTDEPYSTDFIPAGGYEDITVTVEIPELIYERREKDHTYGGATSDLTVTARAINGFSDSATVKTRVNFVAGAEINTEPLWREVEPLGHTQKIMFNISVRNVNNGREGGLTNQDTIDLSVVSKTFLTGWSGSPFDEERWNASLDVKNTTVGGGEIDNDIRLAVFVPSNPFNGSGFVRILAEPRGEGVNPGLLLSDTVDIYVFVKQMGGVSVSVDEPKEQEGAPTDTLSYNFTITNTGNGEDNFTLTPSSEHNWEIEVPGNIVTPSLVPNQNHTVEIKTTVPGYDPKTADKDGTDIGDRDNLSLEVHSVFDESVSDTANATTTVIQGYAVELKPDENSSELDPLSSTDHTISVKNLGNGRDTIDLIKQSPDVEGWSAILSQTSLSVGKGETEYLTVTVNAGDLASADNTFNLTINGISRGDPSKNDTANLTTSVKQIPGIDITVLPPSIQHGKPGDVLTYRFRVNNTGNGRDTFNFTNTSSANWSMVPNMTEATLLSFGSIVVELEVHIPKISVSDDREALKKKGIIHGTVNNIAFKATSELNNQSYSDIETAKAIVDQVFDPRISAGKVKEDVLPDRSATYSIQVKNRGNGNDTISLHNSEDAPRPGFSNLSENLMVDIEPGTAEVVNLTVTPPSVFEPYLGEKYINTITPSSTMGHIQGEGVTFTTTVTFMDLIAQSIPERNINISREKEPQSVNYDFEIMNIPLTKAEGNSPDSFRITVIPVTPKLVDRGWSFGLSMLGNNNVTQNLTFSMADFYQGQSFSLILTSPENVTEIGETVKITVSGKSQTRSMEKKTETSTDVVYVDIRFKGELDLNKEEFKEGGRLEIAATLIVEGTVPVNGLAVKLYINGEEIDSNTSLGRFELSEFKTFEERKLAFEWRLPSLEWDEKATEYKIELRVDEDNKIYETSKTLNSEAETNNEIEKVMWVSDDALHPVVSALLLLFSIGGAVYLYGDLTENRSLYLVYGAFSGVIGATLFALPWDNFGLSGSAATTVGKVIIWFFLILVFTGVALFISLTSKSYIEHLMRKKEKRDRSRYEFSENEGAEEKEKEEGKMTILSDANPLKPYVIAGLGGFIQVPIFFFLITLYSIDTLTFTYSLLGIIYGVIGAAGVYVFIRIDRSVYEHITKAEQILDRIREETLREVGLEDGTEGVEN